MLKAGRTSSQSNSRQLLHIGTKRVDTGRVRGLVLSRYLNGDLMT